MNQERGGTCHEKHPPSPSKGKRLGTAMRGAENASWNVSNPQHFRKGYGWAKEDGRTHTEKGFMVLPLALSSVPENSVID